MNNTAKQICMNIIKLLKIKNGKVSQYWFDGLQIWCKLNLCIVLNEYRFFKHFPDIFLTSVRILKYSKIIGLKNLIVI